ncbi:MAG: hypothetical protein LKG11_01085 [Bacilli bacterium]|jgi:hypothetical protein|nr:hypothetical protein [Bacilli bacterium]
MKKGPMLLIACVVFAMTTVIAFMGVQPENITNVVYIASLNILAMDGSEIAYSDNLGMKRQKVDFVPSTTYETPKGATRRAMEYVYNTKILPENATNQSYYYTVDLNDSFVKPTACDKGAFLFVEPDYEAEGEDEIYHLVTIGCLANDGGPNAVKDQVELVVHFSKE